MLAGLAVDFIVQILQRPPEIIIAEAMILRESVRNRADVLFHLHPTPHSPGNSSKRFVAG